MQRSPAEPAGGSSEVAICPLALAETYRPKCRSNAGALKGQKEPLGGESRRELPCKLERSNSSSSARISQVAGVSRRNKTQGFPLQLLFGACALHHSAAKPERRYAKHKSAAHFLCPELTSGKDRV